MPTATDMPDAPIDSELDASSADDADETLVPDDDAADEIPDEESPDDAAAAAGGEDASTTPEGSATPAAGSDPAVAGATAPAAAARTPYVLTADRKSWNLGTDEAPAYRDGDGNLVIPAAAVQTVERLLRSGIAHQGSFRQTLDRAREEARSQALTEALETHPDVVRSREVLAEFEALLSDADKFTAFVQDFDTHAKDFQLRAAQRALTQLQTKPAAAPQPAPAPTFTVDDATAYLSTELPALLASDPALAVLTGDALTDVVADLAQRRRDFFFYADEDRPEDDVAVGDICCDVDALRAAIAPYARAAAKALQAKETATKAAASNAAKLKAAGLPAGLPAGAPPAAAATAPSPAAPSASPTLAKLPTTPDEMELFKALPLAEQLKLIHGR